MRPWDHLRLFLAVARRGTLTAAARELGVNASTLHRHLGPTWEAQSHRPSVGAEPLHEHHRKAVSAHEATASPGIIRSGWHVVCGGRARQRRESSEPCGGGSPQTAGPECYVLQAPHR